MPLDGRNEIKRESFGGRKWKFKAMLRIAAEWPTDSFARNRAAY